MSSIVICCDGTWNTPDQLDKGVPAPTNVVRLHNAVAETDNEGARQEKYYHPGVGTSGKWWDKAIGGGTGAGLDDNIKSAYQKLCYSYKLDSDIYLFGFSRGAYTVRSLCGFITSCGLLKISDLEPAEVWRRIDHLLRLGYRRKLEDRADWEDLDWKFHNEAGAQIPIRFIGVWDTVGALGIPDDMALLNLLDDRNRYTFHDTTLHHSVKTARHAVAIDERRATFQPTLWADVPAAQDVKQLWFPGVHSDVGGGYHESGLADGALKWMIEEASKCGLQFNTAIKQIKPDHHDMMHDSCDGVFSLLPTQPRSIANFVNQPDQFHDSALQRLDDPPITQHPYRLSRLIAPEAPMALDISARLPWNETGIWLEAGVAYTFTASGEWLDSSIRCGPDGADDGNFQPAEVAHLVAGALGHVESWYGKLFNNTDADFRFTKRQEQHPWFCLMGAIANGEGVDAKGYLIKPETFKIGKARSYVPKRSGYLYAYANDAWNCYGNNRGHVALSLVVGKT
ncbi:DUF2235 domain-containing protein [Pseudomonas fluorescens]|uniref:T6SS Phospholipase effector Tle1-like catalytic domain-containing protein n=1 Tax=Pseudomonas fluorescens TaxID=294 RepID=A0A5E7HCC5_PSEFL|nr:DUF2235 domain-containing protein [Pseudomonas fluorescens]VVO61645.1 hypothetical protein PS847_00827 [Pseudomonas fluorescens]